MSSNNDPANDPAGRGESSDPGEHRTEPLGAPDPSGTHGTGPADAGTGPADAGTGPADPGTGPADAGATADHATPADHGPAAESAAGGTEGAHAAGPAQTRPLGPDAEDVPAGTGGSPAGTAAFAAGPAGARSGRWSRWRSPATAGPGGRRRWPWVLGGIGVLIVGMLIGSAVTLGLVHHRLERIRFADGRPGIAGQPWHGHGAHGRFGAGPHGMGGMPGMPGQGGGQPGAFGGHGGAGGRGGPGGAAPALLGSVTTVSGANLQVTPDGGAAPVTVTVSDATRISGSGVRALSDLHAGDRVAVRMGPDGHAARVSIVPAMVRGTVTAVTGTSTTVVQPDGLPQTVDTSALPTPPVVGQLVAVRGTASGTTIKAQTLVQLPKAG
jgi:hypothetical protein